jgi:hypothetical protein
VRYLGGAPEATCERKKIECEARLLAPGEQDERHGRIHEDVIARTWI